MRVIGLTGGIASGKSTVAHLFAELGAVIIDADQLAREAVEPGSTALAAIVQQFGPEVLQSDGTLDRGALGTVIFANPLARQRLEQITHPAIRELALTHLAALRAAGTAVVIYMAPLLIEAGATDRVDEIWVVHIDSATQLQRLTARDRLSREDAHARVASQMPLEEKRRHGRIVIDNSGTLAETKRQVTEIWQREIVKRGMRAGN
jgi:dephospho-CoA kinase